MDTIRDFEDLLFLFEKLRVRYVIIGGLAFIFHAKPRYTKDMDILIEGCKENIERANAALAEFGSPYPLSLSEPKEILQLGIAPNRIDLMTKIDNVTFKSAWKERIRAPYGRVKANWMGIRSLIRSKSHTGNPRHEDDLRVLKKILDMKAGRRRGIRSV